MPDQRRAFLPAIVATSGCCIYGDLLRMLECVFWLLASLFSDLRDTLHVWLRAHERARPRRRRESPHTDPRGGADRPEREIRRSLETNGSSCKMSQPKHQPATSSRSDAMRWVPDCHKAAPEAGGKRRLADFRAPSKALRPRDRLTVHSVSPIYSGLASGQRHRLARAGAGSVQRMLRDSCVAAKAIVQGRAFGTPA